MGAKVTTLPAKKSRKLSRLVVMNPNKGLNNLVSPLLIDDKEMSDLLNMEFDEGGVLRKRSGFTAVGQALTSAKGLGTFYTESVRYACTVDNGVFSYFNGTTWATVAGASFTVGAEIAFSQARNKLFIWDGASGGAYWDGTTLSRPGTMPKAKFSIYYQNKHIAAGVAGQPNRVYISNATDATDFTVTIGGTQPQPDSTNDTGNGQPNVPGATVFSGTPGLSEANVIDVHKDDGDKITGLGLFLDTVVIFKTHAIYQLTFDSSGAPVVVGVTAATGCLSHKSIQNVENDVLFLSREGIRSFGNAPNFFTVVRTNVLSQKIDPTVKSINTINVAKSNALYINYEYILAVPTATSTIDTCIVQDKRFGGFLKWDTLAPNGMIQFIDANNAAHFYFIHDSGTQMYEVVAGTYNDNGVAINAYVVSKAQDFGTPDLTKRFVDLTLMFRTISGLVTVGIYTDNNISAGSTVIGSQTADGMGRWAFGTKSFGTGTGSNSGQVATTDIAERIKIGQNSRTLKFKISNNRLNESFTFLGYTFGYYAYSPFLFDSTYTIYV
jgi:hypothetical protein